MNNQANGDDRTEKSIRHFPVVGIGASAGGLAMFEAFFSAMPEGDRGMAFVLIQHLDPDHKSMLTELVRRYTRMQVFEVEDGMSVRPNCIYIIPPGRDMAFINGSLQLMEPLAPRGQRMPVDFFLRSLASDLRERAIAIILSGSGSDGAAGIRAIKAEGGMVMAQDPASTEHDGMPRSAIATGMVDFELSPAEMPAQLIAYAAHAFGKALGPANLSSMYSENALKKIFLLLRAQTKHDFSQYKPATIQRRIDRRRAIHKIGTLLEYIDYLRHNPSEVDALFRDLLIGVTNFFRDPEAFQALEKEIILKLFEEKAEGSLIRVWIPGCSTGEEAYSIAILLKERAEALKKNFTIQIFATDIDSHAIASARTGIFPASIAGNIQKERFARFFTTEPGTNLVRVNKNIRDLLVFSDQDLVRDPPFSKLDLISCRNLLIYMGGELQKKIIPLFHYALSSNGFLFLGTSESIGEFSDLFITLDRSQKIFRQKPAADATRNRILGRMFHSPTPMEIPPMNESLKPQVPAPPPFRELTEKMLLQHMAPIAALVNAQGDIFYLHGRTGLYLEPAPGESGVNNILKMAREGLRRDLTIGLHKTIGTKEIVRYYGLMVKTNGDFTATNLTIRPVSVALSGMQLYLVILEKSSAADAKKNPGDLSAPTAAGSEGEESIAALKRELRAKEEYLQTSNEELETSNEELKSSNDEMQSINEELQSTNEELETSKEELQSVNEELATVNVELQIKVTDLSRANNDLNNLLAGTGMGTVFIDHQHRIVRFTPAATQIINLIESDVGRPMSDIVSNLIGYQDLISDVKAVLENLMPKELDVQTQKGAWYTMRIMPYRTLENVIEGAVITFINITHLRIARETLLVHQERTRVALLASPLTVSNQDYTLRYTWIQSQNPAHLPEQVIGKTDAELFPLEDAGVITAVKQRVLDTGVGTQEVIRMKASGGDRSYQLTVEPLRNGAGEIIGITSVTIENAVSGGDKDR